MNSLITYLEAIAVDNLDLALPARLAPAVRAALIAADGVALRRELSAPRLTCSVMLPEQDEPMPEEQPATPDGEPDESQSQAA